MDLGPPLRHRQSVHGPRTQPIVWSGKAEIFKPELLLLVSEARHVGDGGQVGEAEACLDRPDPCSGPDLPT